MKIIRILLYKRFYCQSYKQHVNNIKLLIKANLGSIRIGKNQKLRGGISDPRNKTLLKMFNLIDIGERSGSGVPNIFDVWSDAGLEEPEIMEKFNPDRTILRLPLVEKQSAKTVGKNSRQMMEPL